MKRVFIIAAGNGVDVISRTSASGAYGASKAAVIAYCESLRVELKPDGGGG